jgi:hypothetical protein
MPLNLAVLSLKELHKLGGGKLALAFEREVSRIHADIVDRPADERARKLKLVFSFTPGRVEALGVDTVDVDVACRADVPPYQTRPYECKSVPKSGELLFNLEAPENVDQHTIDMGLDYVEEPEPDDEE